MRESILHRKQARIVMMLSEELHIELEQALDIFYSSHTYELLCNPDTGLQLMSDSYILEDFLKELQQQKV